jgi:putative ABC transport system permease protein
MSTPWKMAWRNLGRNRRRNLATGMAIAFGYAGLLLLGGYIIRTEHYLRVNSIYLNHAGHIAIFKEDGLDRHLTKPSAYSLTLDEQKQISSLIQGDPRIEFTGKYLLTSGLIGNGCKSVPFFATGIDLDTEKKIRNHPEVLEWNPELIRPKQGTGLWESSPSSSDAFIGITPGLADALGKPLVYSEVPRQETGVPVSALNCSNPESMKQIASDTNVQLAGRSFFGDFSALDADIENRYSTGLALSDDVGLEAPLSLLQKLYETDSVTYIALYLRDRVRVHSFLEELKKKFADSGLKVTLYSYDTDEMSLFYVGVLNFLLTMAAFFIFLVFGVVALSIINSMTMSIIERTKEIGTLRSLGFSRQFIAAILTRETLLLSLISLAAGLGLTLGVAGLVNSVNIRFTPPGVAGDMQFMLTPDSRLCVVVAILILALSCETARQTAMRKTRRTVAELLTSSTG